MVEAVEGRGVRVDGKKDVGLMDLRGDLIFEFAREVIGTGVGDREDANRSSTSVSESNTGPSTPSNNNVPLLLSRVVDVEGLDGRNEMSGETSRIASLFLGSASLECGRAISADISLSRLVTAPLPLSLFLFLLAFPLISSMASFSSGSDANASVISAATDLSSSITGVISPPPEFSLAGDNPSSMHSNNSCVDSASWDEDGDISGDFRGEEGKVVF